MIASLTNTLTRLWADECGAETLEFAVVTGLIVVAAIGFIKSVGTKVLAKWTSLNASM